VLGAFGTGYFGEQHKIKEAVEKGTKKGACSRIRKRNEEVESQRKRRRTWINHTQEVGMWKNLIHLGLGFWSLM
jgi:hypothetical protein